MFTSLREIDQVRTKFGWASCKRNLLAIMTKLIIPRSITASIFLFFFASSAWAVDPSKHISQYAHTAWRGQDGVFSGTPRVFAQAADGYIWIGTTDGMVRFDGVRFVPWVPPNGQQLPSPRINYLLGARDGSLWIGTARGLSHWQDDHLTNYLDHPGIVPSIAQAPNGSVWFVLANPAGVTGRLCQVMATDIQCHGKEEGIPELNYISLAADGLGNLWMGAETALIRWRPDSHRVFNLGAPGPNTSAANVMSLAPDSDGSLWVGTILPGPGLGLQRVVKDDWKPFVTTDLNSATVSVTALFLDRQHALWVGTSKQGILRIYDGKVERFSSTDGLSGDYVWKFFEDREGNVWVVTPKGIDNFRDVRVASFSTREGLLTEEVDSVVATRDGAVWIGSSGWLGVLRNAGITFLVKGKDLPGDQVTSLLEDHAGRLWVGLDEGLATYMDGKFRLIKSRDGTPLGMVVGITEDVHGDIWVETKKAPMRLIQIQDFQGMEEFPAPQIPAARRVTSDPEGGLWLGLLNGDLARYQDGKTEVFHFEHSQDSRVEQVTVNPDGSVLGATEFGLIGWKRGQLLTLTVRNGLPCNVVHSFVGDDQGNLWLYAQCGVIEIKNAELQKWWDHPDAVIQVRLFDAFDGAQPARAPFGSAARSRDGRLWFANGNLLQMVDPNHLTENSIVPPVHVERIVADRESYSPGRNLGLPPRTRDLEIDYTALSFVAPQKVRFRYKLEGRDTQWQEAGTRRQAFYSDLRPGEYRFRVIACNNDGIWNEEGATLDFRVAPAWYQTNWFLFLSLTTGLFVVWALYRLRVRQVAHGISARFDERLAERTRLARELHDTLLQTIQGSKMVADDALEQSADTVRLHRAMEKLSVWLGQAVDEGRAALNSLRTSTVEKNDLAAAFRRATENCVIHGAMTPTLSVVGDSKDMHPIVRDEVYRIGYEAIRNACMHSEANHLEVNLRYGQDLVVRVKDDGKGIEPVIASLGKDGHFGLQGMRERAVRIGAKLTLNSSAPSGTEITLVVPGDIAFRKSPVAIET
jgi:signal transduction histidine kinase/ligand-binding sensor domain-containing protein